MREIAHGRRSMGLDADRARNAVAMVASATARIIEIVDVTAAPLRSPVIERATDHRGVDLLAIAAAVARTKALIAMAGPPLAAPVTAPADTSPGQARRPMAAVEQRAIPASPRPAAVTPPIPERHLGSREIDGPAIVALLAQALRPQPRSHAAGAAADPAAPAADPAAATAPQAQIRAAGGAMAAMRTAAPAMLERPVQPPAVPRVTPRAMTATTAAIAQALKATPLPAPPFEIAQPIEPRLARRDPVAPASTVVPLRSDDAPPAHRNDPRDRPPRSQPIEDVRPPADPSAGLPARLPASAVLVGFAQTARRPMATSANRPAAAIAPLSMHAAPAPVDATSSAAALSVIPVPMAPIQLPSRPVDVAPPDIRSWLPPQRARQVTAFGLRAAMIGLRIAILTILAAVVFWTMALVGYRYVDPPASTLMLGQYLTGRPVEQRWLPINRMSPHLIRAVMASEDGNFCRHRGVDWSAIDEALDKASGNGGRMRGASTISMQTVKNLMLWPQAHYIRKVLELPLAYAAEKAWGKRRMLELYLNIAEWGPGTFGAEAAAQLHFRKSASALSPKEAALLAVALPNPIERNAGRPGPGTQRLARLIETRAVRPSLAITCLGLGRLQP